MRAIVILPFEEFDEDSVIRATRDPASERPLVHFKNFRGLLSVKLIPQTFVYTQSKSENSSISHSQLGQTIDSLVSGWFGDIDE